MSSLLYSSICCYLNGSGYSHRDWTSTHSCNLELKIMFLAKESLHSLYDTWFWPLGSWIVHWSVDFERAPSSFPILYRGATSVRQLLVSEHCGTILLLLSFLLDPFEFGSWDCCLFFTLGTKNAGCSGTGRQTESALLSIRTIVSMAGRASLSFWIQSKPMWMHLITSVTEIDSLIIGSTIPNGAPLLQCSQT